MKRIAAVLNLADRFSYQSGKSPPLKSQHLIWLPVKRFLIHWLAQLWIEKMLRVLAGGILS